MENSEPQSQGNAAKQKEIDDLRSENAFMERMGYVLAMRLLQTDIELDGEESGAISVFVPKTPSVGRGNAAGAVPVTPKSALPASTQGAPETHCTTCSYEYDPECPVHGQPAYPVAAPLLSEEETEADLRKLLEAAVQMGEVNLEDRDIN